MMRVISGKYKSKKIDTLKTNDTRPTTDKVRENIFNILSAMDGAVLDLFAGSGALGIEAMSRGCNTAVFIDGAQDAVKLIYKNTEYIKEHIEIFRNDYKRALQALEKRNKTFDYIFVDPPYKKGLVKKVLEDIALYNVLNQEGVIVIESHKDEVYETGKFVSFKDVTYGLVRVNFLRMGD